MIPDANPNDRTQHRQHDPERQVSGKEPKTDAAIDSDQKHNAENEDPKNHAIGRYYAKYRVFVHIFIWLFITGYVTHLRLKQLANTPA
jgi:CNT family concentrative nucleoside transporter